MAEVHEFDFNPDVVEIFGLLFGLALERHAVLVGVVVVGEKQDAFVTDLLGAGIEKTNAKLRFVSCRNKFSNKFYILVVRTLPKCWSKTIPIFGTEH